MVTLVFGDSIAWGAYDDVNGGWVELIKMVGFSTDNFVYNCSISGNTTNQVLGRMSDEINCRMDINDDLRIIFAIGINDASRVHNSIHTELLLFSKNIEQIIEQAKKYTYDIWFVGLTRVNEEKTNPVEWDKYLTYSNNDIDEYDNMLKIIVEARLDSKNYIPINSSIAEFTEDGTHLTPFGHRIIFENVRDTFIEHEKQLNKIENE